MSFEQPGRSGRPNPEHEPRPPRVTPDRAITRALGRAATSDTVTLGDPPRSEDLIRDIGRTALAREATAERTRTQQR